MRYYQNGQLTWKATFKDGEQYGLSEKYYENGQLKEKRPYKDGELNGLVEAYDENGQENPYLTACYQNDYRVDISKCK